MLILKIPGSDVEELPTGQPQPWLQHGRHSLSEPVNFPWPWTETCRSSPDGRVEGAELTSSHHIPKSQLSEEQPLMKKTEICQKNSTTKDIKKEP